MQIVERLSEIEAVTGGQARISDLSLRPRMWQLHEQAFPNYFEDQPTPPNAFRDDEQWFDSEVDDILETNHLDK